MKQLVKRNLGLAIAIISLFISSSVFAQPPGGGGQKGGQQGRPPVPNSKQVQKMVTDLSKALFLNEKQETEISTIYVDHFSEVSNKMKSGRPERTEMEALETKFEKKVSAVLTEEQQKLYANYLKKNAKKQMGDQRPN